MAIDLGTSRVRCLVVDTRGTIKSVASADWEPLAPKTLAPLGREISPSRTWALICRLARQAMRDAGISGAVIAAVSATSQRQGMVLLDREGSELYAGPNTDLRAFMEGQRIDEVHRDLVYRTTGRLPSFLFTPAKVLWLKSHQPEVFERVDRALSLDAWVLWKLCGEAVMERSAAAESGLADVATGERATDLLIALGLSAGLVPRLVDAGQPVGGVTKTAAAGTGLSAGTSVIAAGPDTQCGMLGMGAVDNGQVGIVAGWSAPVQMVVDRFRLDPGFRTWSGRHLLRGKWVLESTVQDTGGAYRWLGSMLAAGRAGDVDAYIAKQAARAPIGSNGVLAFLGPRTANMGQVGPRWGGLLIPMLSTAMPAQRSELLRGYLENLAYAIRGNTEQLGSVTGQASQSIGFAGGMARNALLLRILADVLGRPVERSRITEVTGLGAAMCAAAGLGAHGSLEDASRAMAKPARPVLPDPVSAMEYEEHYRRWGTVGQRLDVMGDTL